MQEYVTDAIVLAKQPSGELDGRYSLFTKKFGKMTGRTKSSRKITSKLAGHLEPGNAVKARFIEKSGTQIVDALKVARAPIALRDLAALNDLLPEMDPDVPLWECLVQEPFSWANILRLLGWDPEGAGCATCDTRHVTWFYIPQQEFFCAACVSGFQGNGLSLISVHDE